MPSDAAIRTPIVEALDELDEHPNLADAWLGEAETPYPPKAVRERSKRLRWQIRGRRAVFFLFVLLVAVAGGLGVAGWSIPGVLSGALLGFSGAAAIVPLFVGSVHGRQVRALQLYELLEEIDDSTGSATPVGAR